ncbi:MAG: aspartate-semialdehyde dehydrogenase [Planctomycetota bacterium]|nr:aspartate-semialdehyde dehydrogenase [Planctomycetota bacterium]
MTSVAVVGATGAVGAEILVVLEQRAFPVGDLRLLASARSAGGRLEALGAEHEIREATAAAFEGVDLALFSAGSDIARALAPEARKAGALVVDNSSAFRADPQCPLVVPEVNGDALQAHQGIVANPNCSTILLAMLLEPIRKAAGLRRVIVSTYQAVSGAGARAVEELRSQEAADAAGTEPTASVFPRVLSHNVIPWVQDFQEDGYTPEETKVRDEARRILDLPDLLVSATCVRVPVWRAHSQAVHVETERPLDPEDARRVLGEAEGVRVWDKNDFPTPREVAGTDEVHVGRIRADRAFPGGLALWGVMDQLRKGAALNAVQIAERILGVAGKAGRRT